MTPFQLATGFDRDRQKRTRDELIDLLLKDQERAKEACKTEHVPSVYEIAEVIDQMMKDEERCKKYMNDKYQVSVRDPAPVFSDEWPEMIWLSIRRLDREPIREWPDLQRIKNELVGPENEGFEIFPAESRLVNSANQFHLYVFKDPSIRIPTGFTTRLVTNQIISTTKQRPIEG